MDRKGADLLSMLLLDVFFPCNILAAASGDFGDMPFSQVIKIALAYMSCFILFTLLASMMIMRTAEMFIGVSMLLSCCLRL